MNHHSSHNKICPCILPKEFRNSLIQDTNEHNSNPFLPCVKIYKAMCKKFQIFNMDPRHFATASVSADFKNKGC